MNCSIHVFLWIIHCMRQYGALGTYIPVPGSSAALFIYKIETSQNWYAYLRCDGRTVRKSTGCTDQEAAFAFARRLATRVETTEGETLDFTFRNAADSYVKAEALRVGLGEVGPRSLIEERIKLKNLIIPSIGHLPLDKLNRTEIAEFLIKITEARSLRFTTRNRYLVVIRKVLKHAHDAGMLLHLPLFPAIKQDDRPRGYFTAEEMGRLLDRLDRLASSRKPTVVKISKAVTRSIVVQPDTVDFVRMAANCFVRPSDLKLLRHRHIRVHMHGEIPVLLIDSDHSKTTVRTSMTMPEAARAYQRVMERQKRKGGSIDPDDYVFMPQSQNRDYALREIRYQIDVAMRAEGLKIDPKGMRRSLYSFRHTAFMDRLLNSDIDPVTLALNGRTSVAIIARFYGSHIEAIKKIDVFLGHK